MSARPRRPPAPDLSTFTSLECLLLAQSVYELGAASPSWTPVSKILSKHPLLSRPKSFFTPVLCNAWYNHLLKEANLERTDKNNAIKAEPNLHLARKYFKLRHEELSRLIKDEEAKFKSVVSEIEDIRAGKWDARIKAQLAGVSEDALLKQESNEVAKHESPGEREEAVSQAASTKPGSPPTSPREEAVGTAEVVTPLDDDATEPDIDIGKAPASARSSVPIPMEGSQAEEEEEEEDAAQELQKEASKEVTKMDGQRTSTPEARASVEADQASDENEVEMDEGEDLLEVDSDDREGISEHQGTPTTQAEPEPEHARETQHDEGESSGDEPLQTVRRSARRKSSASSVPPLLTKPRTTRRQRQIQEHDASPGPESEFAHDADNRGGSPRTDDNVPSSPFESAGSRTREGKRKASFVDALDPSNRDSKRLREDSEYADDDDHAGSPAQSSHNTRSRPTRHNARSEEQVALKRFQSVIGLVHSQISQHRNGTIFHNPIKVSEAPDYHEIVKKPMDLKSIKTRVKDGLITNSLEFQRDIYLMFANAMMYNRPGSDVYTMAEDMMFEAEKQIHSFRQTEGFVRGVHR